MVDVLVEVEAALLGGFGHRPARASVSFVGVEPIEVLRFEPVTGERCYVTLGMSRHPMTAATEAVVSADGPRAELLLRLWDPLDEHADVWRRLAVLAAAPAVDQVVYRPDATVDLGEPLVPGSQCVGAVVIEGPLAEVATPAGPVRVLQVVPATATELAWARVHGAAALRARWAEHDVDLADVTRGPVPLA